MSGPGKSGSRDSAPDFGLLAADYSRYRPGYPAEVFDRLTDRGLLEGDPRVIDIGCGPGLLGLELARRGARITGVDLSHALLVAAAERARIDASRTAWTRASAEALPLRTGSVDLACAAQCWHWFDGPAAAREISRVLRPGGSVAIVHFDWIHLPGSVVGPTEELITAHNPDWLRWNLAGGLGIYPDELRDLAGAGFRSIESFSVDAEVPFSHGDWRRRIRASSGVGASLSPQGIAAFDRDLARLLSADFPREPLAVPHRLFCVTAVRPTT